MRSDGYPMPSQFRPEPPRDAHLCWIESQIVGDLASEGTDAHRLATGATAWIERFGEDVVISHRDASSRDFAKSELDQWKAESAINTRRVFGRFVPIQNEERVAPVLLEGDPGLPPAGTARE